MNPDYLLLGNLLLMRVLRNSMPGVISVKCKFQHKLSQSNAQFYSLQIGKNSYPSKNWIKIY